MIGIVGGGRMGRGLALALGEAGERVSLWSRREAAGAVEDAVSAAHTVLLAVPDDAITAVATQLAATNAIETSQVVLHLSGLLDIRALRPLEPTGAALGSFHPLQTVSDPGTAPARWRGAVATVEGDPRAMVEGERLARLLGLEPVRIASESKASYHAGAVMASNYVVALVAMAARLAEAGGVPAALARRMYLPLLQGAVDGLARQAPAQALTGPIARGDIATVRTHLEALGANDRVLYARLGLEALVLARQAGLDSAKADEIERVLRDY
jgi:predicted short-subunit dehydrogenase-like oxidoreductase (DUF2520 family)